MSQSWSRHRWSGVTVTDQFCGAGGSSLGAVKGGAEVALALNHWQLAIETHNTNFPQTYHECCDISAADPRRYPATDILITSPECTNHSVANGKKKPSRQLDLWEPPTIDPSAERSRATMWDVPRFAEFHKYECIIVENVVDARRWVMWDSWWHAMTVSLGYEGRCVYLNSMHAHPTPQSRDRMYVVFWKKGNKAPDLNITPRAWCMRCARDVASVQVWKNPAKPYGKYRTQYVYCCPTCATQVEPYYYAAANAIDWSLAIERIGDRKHPLKPKTLERIRLGLERFARQPILFTTDQSAIQRNLKALLADPFCTQTTATTMGMAVPDGYGFLFDQTRFGERERDVREPWPAQTATQTQAMALVPPFILPPGWGGHARDAMRDLMPTAITEAEAHLVAANPFIFTQGAWDNVYRQLEEALPGVSTTRDFNLVVPWILEVGHGGAENAGRQKAVTDALPTAHTLGGLGMALAPMTVSLEHGGVDHLAQSVSRALGTQSTRQGMALILAPYIANLRNHGRLTGLEEALRTITAGGNNHGVVGVPHPFITDYYGHSTAHSAIEDALTTATSVDGHGLSIPDAGIPDVEDVYFRVLKPHEIQAAMAFPDTYKVLGTSRERVHQLGNAVTPPAMEELIGRCLDTLRSERSA